MSKRTVNQEARRTMMLNEPLYKVIPKMAIPTIIAFLINSIYSLADTYFVSSLGTNATAAVSVNASLDQLIMMCGSMLAVGANSYIARLMGEGEDKKSQPGSVHRFLHRPGHRRRPDGLRQYLYDPHGPAPGCHSHLRAVLH